MCREVLREIPLNAKLQIPKCLGVGGGLVAAMRQPSEATCNPRRRSISGDPSQRSEEIDAKTLLRLDCPRQQDECYHHDPSRHPESIGRPRAFVTVLRAKSVTTKKPGTDSGSAWSRRTWA